MRQVYEFLRGLEQSPIELTQQEVKETLGLQIGNEGVGACEKLLDGAGAIERLESSENMAAVRLASDVPTLVELLPPQARSKRRIMRAVEQLVGARRHDWCYLQPREILRELTDLDSTDLSRHLREMTSLSAFDYIPPFRGRAIHVPNRELAFGDIEIDFETLEKQKAAEYERLEQVLRFARDHRCRQKRILEYFGQQDAGNCGNCDNCQPTTGGGSWGSPNQVSGPVLDAVRIVLSGVARVSQRRVGCGKQLLAKMLCGSSDKAVQRNRLDKLSTFGLLSHLKQTDVAQLADALLLAGLLEQNEIEPFRPIVQLTAVGLEVMSGRAGADLALSLPDELRHKLDPNLPPEARSAASPDADLVARLRAWRDTTRQAHKVPAYVILTNAVIDELARVRPRTRAELSGVKGIGAKKAEQFGGELLEIIAPAARQLGEEQAPVNDAKGQTRDVEPVMSAQATLNETEPVLHVACESSAEAAIASRAQASHYWTWRLLSHGFTPDECAAIRSLEADVVLDHALRTADSGLPIDARWFLTEQQIAAISSVVGPALPSRIRPLLGKLPRGTRYEDVQLVVKSRPSAS